MDKENVGEIRPRRVSSGQSYRDEMNFAEFPLSSLSDTITGNQKTLEFSDEIFDPSRGKAVVRTLTVTAADKFGLPTALDDEVLLGLVQVSCGQGFADRKVHFSRYELIKLLGWRDESKSYKRIEDSLNRWTGVTLHYDNAWWSKEEGCLVSETFHVLEKATVFDRERIARRRKMAADGSPVRAVSSFVWSETVFQSFKSGYMRSFDFDFYKSLESAIAKRMFRFLDKRFFHRRRWDFDLGPFATEKLGLSKSYSNSQLKRKLLPAIQELEKREFLVPLGGDERFVKVRQGDWKAIFVKASKKLTVHPHSDGDSDSLARDLVARGITPRSAKKLLDHHDRLRIEEKVRLFDWMKVGPGEGAIRNRAGWLYSAIVYDYAVPEAAREVVASPHPSATAVRPVFESRPQEPPATVTEGPKVVAFDAFWAKLSSSERDSFESEALEAAPAFLQKQYHDGAEGRGTLWRVTRRRILADHFATAAQANIEKGSG